ncbi:outer membrane lipoprotein-sorting protein [bacterium]|nr:outer membrane lipoprotein-sorting protein [bacterium]
MKIRFILTPWLAVPALIICHLLFPLLAPAEDTLPDVQTIIDHVDRLYRSESSYAEMEMTVVSEHWERTISMNAWTEGLEKTFIDITSPKKDKGIATLRMDTEMWNYFPKINKVMKVPPSMMMGSWMGSDFTNDDLVKESSLIRDYSYELYTPDDAEEGYYYVELKPKEETPSVWGRITIVVSKDTFLPVSESYYDEKDRKMRHLIFSEVKDFGGRTIPSVLEMVSLNKEGHRTVIRYKEIEFDVPLDKDVFTLRNLRKRR